MLKHKRISLELYDSTLLFLKENFNCLFKLISCFINWKNEQEYTILFEEGCKKIYKETDVSRIVKKMRELRVLMKGHLFSEELAFLVKNDRKNVINLGESTESEIDYDRFKSSAHTKSNTNRGIRKTKSMRSRKTSMNIGNLDLPKTPGRQYYDTAQKATERNLISDIEYS